MHPRRIHKLKELGRFQAAAAGALEAPDEQDLQAIAPHQWKEARDTARAYLASTLGQETADREVLRAEADLDCLNKHAPSPYRRPWEYWTLARNESWIFHAAHKCKHIISERPVIGMIPFGEVNAVVGRVSADHDYVILFNSGMKAFNNLTSKVIVELWVSVMQVEELRRPENHYSRSDALHRHVTAQSALVQRYARILEAVLFHGNPIVAGFKALPNGIALLANTLEQAADLFVLGHEYGHMIGNHFRPESERSVLIGNQTVNKQHAGWKAEFEADRYGLQLMLNTESVGAQDPVLRYCGADFYFTCIDSMERAWDTAFFALGLQTNDPSTSSHPPTPLRRAQLRRHAHEFLSPEQVKAAISLSEMLAVFAEMMHEEFRLVLIQLCQSGRTLAPAWPDIYKRP